MNNVIDSFRKAMADAGLGYHGEIKADKQLHRFDLDKENGKSCWYKLHPDGPIPAGAFGCWRRNINQTWHLKPAGKINPQEYAEVRRVWKEAEAQRARDDKERHERMAVKALEVVSGCSTPHESHFYLAAKGVGIYGDLKENSDGDLVLPLEDAQKTIWSYQTIDALGDKLFMPAGRVSGCMFWIDRETDGPLVVCEGYATGATIHQATGYAVCCAMNCGNIPDVAKSLREIYPERIIIIAADNDRFTKRGDDFYNPGVEKATVAATSTKAVLVVPQFPAGSKGTDFNDLAKETTIGIVRGCFDAALGVGMGRRVRINDLLAFLPNDDKDSLIGRRYLCRGGSCVIVAQTSAGKSSLGMQMAVMWALGLDFFGLRPRRPLRSLIVQAENDDGDTAEMFQGILLGLGLMSETDPDGNLALIKTLEKNLIIIRDQTHIGMNFPPYAKRLVEIHQPDLFWTDPLLSFFGDDINDQKAMSQFLRAELNPISEKTGIIWMMLHHTGKPSKDAKKAQKSWSSRDYSYMGIGSSELSNWARAIMCLTNTSEDEFRLILAKRGWRAGVVDDGGAPSTEIHMAYSSEHICWRRIPKPEENGEMDSKLSAFVRGIDRPMRASEIIKLASTRLQRGERTCWSLWDRGGGDLGVFFEQNSDSLWVPKNNHTPSVSTPYKDSE